jgi:hypothetical protein
MTCSLARAGETDRFRSASAASSSRCTRGTASGGSGPCRANLWDAHATGPGTQTVVWPVRSGDWTVVAMNANGSRPVSVHVDVAATLPELLWIAGGLLAGGIIVLAAGVLLLVIPIRRASR